jgi:hypothetical protein
LSGSATSRLALAQDATDCSSCCPSYTPEAIDPLAVPGFPFEFFDDDADDEGDVIA